MPPPLVVMILLPLNENAASAPCPPAGAPRYVAPRDLVARTHVAQRVVVAALAVEVDRDDGPNPSTGGAPGSDRGVEQLRVHRPRVVAVDEHRLRGGVADRVRAGRERVGRAHDLVAGPDPEDDEREMQRRRAARKGERVLHAGDAGELTLECVDVRAERRHDVRLERIPHELELMAGLVRR
jgi:hypothetical protein